MQSSMLVEQGELVSIPESYTSSFITILSILRKFLSLQDLRVSFFPTPLI